MKIKNFFIGIIILSSSFINPAYAEINSMSLKVDGLSCPFCALSLEKKLKSVPMVSTVDVHLKKAKTDLTFKQDMPLDLSAIRKAVKEAGFTLRDIETTILGTVKKNEDDFFVIESQGDKTQFLLFDENHADVDANLSDSQMLNGKVEMQLSKAQQENTLIKVTGVIHQHSDIPFGLLIKELEVNSNAKILPKD